ncbi:MAG TPA: TonB-dependent receptor, partial [Longimicrobiales bacterium]|nr:TonB-dependent receptor [Longimicrobiales bacterium]
VVQNGPQGSVTSVFFRGGESDYVQVLVDGVQVNQPGGSFDFSGLTTEGVERVEVVRGPASALHGSDAVSGVIHVITRDGARASPAALVVQGGSHGRMDGTLSLAGGGERASYGVSLARYTGDGTLAFNNAHENSILSGKAALRLDDATRARISGRIAERRYHFPTDGSGALVDRNQFTFADESSLSVEVERTLGDKVQLRALASSYAVDGGTDDAPDGPADTLGFFGFQSLDSYRRSAVDVRVNVSLAPGLTTTVGGEYEIQRVRSFNESLSEYGPSTGRSANDRGNRAGYLHLAGGRGALSGNAGVRYEDNEAYGGFLSWQAGASWRVAGDFRVRAAAGRGIKEPTFFETFATGFTVGNPSLEPEVSTSWEIGAEQTLLQGRVALQATWFQQRFRDLIQYTFAPPAPGGSNYYNVAAARARGVEASASLALGPWRLGVDGSWLDTEVTDAGFDEGEGATFVQGEALLRRPTATMGLSLGWRPADALRLDVSARRTGSRWDRDFSDWPAAPVELSAYTRVDAGAEWTVLSPRGSRPGMDLLLRLENLGDARYQEVFGFPAPGRAVMVGGRLSMAR